MANSYRPWTPRQAFLLPPSPTEWLPAGHLAYFVLDVVGELDLRAIEGCYEQKDARGTRPYSPRLMVALLLYGYCVGVVSSRRLERASYEDVAFRVLGGGEHPDHTSISEFRRVHLTALSALFVQVLRLCQKAGLVKLGHVALDGTKVRANASKHKAMSYERMLKSEAELAKEVAELLARAERTDRGEDDEHGKGRSGDELPEELRYREGRLQRIREARQKLEAEAAEAKARERREQLEEAERGAVQASGQNEAAAREKLERARDKSNTADQKAREEASEAELPEPDTTPRREREMPRHQVPADKTGTPTPKAQRNFTDPDSRIHKSADGFIQAYNAQAVVDSERQVIVATDLSNQPPDNEYLVPMLAKVEENCGRLPDTLSCDSGYWSERNDEWCQAHRIDDHIATGRQAHGEKPAPARGRIPANLNRKGRMSRKLRTKRGRETYALRKQIVEPVFGQMKDARGLRRFLLRGIEKARAEWSLWCASHNLLKLFRAGAASAATA